MNAVPTPPAAPRARRDRGFTFIELMLAVFMAAALMAAVVPGVVYSTEASARTPVRALAVNGVVELAERIAATPIDSVWATWGTGGTEGPTFTVPALAGVTHTGSIKVLIDETKTDATLGYSLGFPRDLDGDGLKTTANVALTAKVLVVVVDLTWSYAGGKNNRFWLPVTVMRAPTATP